MTPTNELRFVERQVGDWTQPTPRIIRVLQQKWSGDHPNWSKPIEEWRDVPCVKEPL